MDSESDLLKQLNIALQSERDTHTQLNNIKVDYMEAKMHYHIARLNVIDINKRLRQIRKDYFSNGQ